MNIGKTCLLVSASNVRAVFLVAAEEERLPPVITDALFRLALNESALPVASQYAGFKILKYAEYLLQNIYNKFDSVFSKNYKTQLV
jgi:hypothetical protein